MKGGKGINPKEQKGITEVMGNSKQSSKSYGNWKAQIVITDLIPWKELNP